jgi:hypothetical protein
MNAAGGRVLMSSRPSSWPSRHKVLAVVMFAAAMGAFADAHAQQAGVWVRGGIDCGQWAASRSNKSGSFFEAYVLGYLDGFSMGRHSEFWKADGRLISDEAVYLWLDEHCKANPLQAIQSGLFVLFTDRANDTSN